MVYLHLPFPHHPSFYAKSFFDKKNNFYNTDNEIINFNLTSYVIEKLFNIVNSKEMNQEILTIVTSDHGLRKPNTITLVPMIISSMPTIRTVQANGPPAPETGWTRPLRSDPTARSMSVHGTTRSTH